MSDEPTALRSCRILWNQLRDAFARNDSDSRLDHDRLLDRLSIQNGDETMLPSTFAVSAFATAAVSVTTLAAAELLATRRGTPAGTASSSPEPVRRVLVDARAASAAFRSEALFEPMGWERPPIWDPIAGDYRARDRFIRLHTNYASHRRAVMSVLGCSAERAAVASAVRTWDASALEAAVVDAGGCAAALHSRDEWAKHEHGSVTLDESAIALEAAAENGGAEAARSTKDADVLRPLQGIRVLDLTRVIAGPVCTRVLAAHGADVVRIDPPGFEEVPAVVPDVTVGKRCTTLDLASREGRRIFLDWVAQADVVVAGYRPGALTKLGLGIDTLRRANPALVFATLDAYGWRGPWRDRRGFDSLVQMSTGIAAAGIGGAGDDKDLRPVPLPAQALDHGIGWLLAAGVCRALTGRHRTGRICDVRGSLIGAANHLFGLGLTDGPSGSATAVAWPEDVFETDATAWGPARRVRCPGEIEGCPRPSWAREAGRLGESEIPPSGPWLASRQADSA